MRWIVAVAVLLGFGVSGAAAEQQYQKMRPRLVQLTAEDIGPQCVENRDRVKQTNPNWRLLNMMRNNANPCLYEDPFTYFNPRWAEDRKADTPEDSTEVLTKAYLLSMRVPNVESHDACIRLAGETFGTYWIDERWQDFYRACRAPNASGKVPESDHLAICSDRITKQIGPGIGLEDEAYQAWLQEWREELAECLD